MDYDPTLPLPAWAAPGETWETLIARMRMWLAPDSAMLSDAMLQQLMLQSPSFLHAVRAGWNAKIPYYADPNRLLRGSIGSESLTFPDPNDLISWVHEIVGQINKQLGIGGSRVLGISNSVQVWGVTPYQLAPPPYVYHGKGEQPEPLDLTRFPPQAWTDRSPWRT